MHNNRCLNNNNKNQCTQIRNIKEETNGREIYNLKGNKLTMLYLHSFMMSFFLGLANGVTAK